MRIGISTLVILAAIVLTVAGLTQLGSPVVARVATDTLIRLVFVIGLSIFVSNSGVLSFGHTSFAAIGGYGSAWFTMPVTAKTIFLPQLPAFVLATQTGFPLGALIGVAAAAATALAIGVVIVRLSGIAASIATLAWLSIVFTVFSNADAYTKGASSLVGLPLAVGPGTAMLGALGALSVAFAFRRSSMGLMLNASREDEIAALASGISVTRLRLAAFVLSAVVVASGGALQAHFLGVLSIGQFYLELTFLTLAMLIVGGMHSLSGAVIGTVLISLVAEVLRTISGGIEIAGITLPALPGLRELGLAAMMLTILLLRPRGLMGDAELRVPRWRSTSSAARLLSEGEPVRPLGEPHS